MSRKINRHSKIWIYTASAATLAAASFSALPAAAHEAPKFEALQAQLSKGCGAEMETTQVPATDDPNNTDPFGHGHKISITPKISNPNQGIQATPQKPLSCTVRIPVIIPKGVTVAVLRSQFRGGYFLDRAKAHVSVFQGWRGVGDLNRNNTLVNRTQIKDYIFPNSFSPDTANVAIEPLTLESSPAMQQVEDPAPTTASRTLASSSAVVGSAPTEPWEQHALEPVLWSPCGGQAYLEIGINVHLTGSKSRDLFFQLDSIDSVGNFTNNIQFIWKKCR